MFRAMKLFHSNVLPQSGHLIRAISRNIATKRKMSSEKPVTIGTHSGIFHCDEILACFMLRQLPQYANAKILRSRDEKVLKDCDIVVDVGGQYDKSKNLFDHHQKSFVHTFSSLRPEYPNYDKVRLSSAGLIYTHFGEEVIREILKKQCDLTIDNHLLGKIFEKVYQGLIQEIDGIDNGVPMFDGEPKYRITSDISSRVGRFNPDWNATEGVDVQQQFEKAMVIAGEEFLDRVLYYGSVWHPARAIVEEALENRFTIHSSGQILSLDRICPWKDHLFDVEKEKELVGVAKYVLFCSGRDDYRAIAVPKEPGSFILRKALHKDWQGVRDADLQKICGIEGAVFVHATGFIGGNKTMQGALEMAIKSLEADE